MKSFLSTVSLFIVILALTNAAEVRKCPKSDARQLNPDEVTMPQCPKNKCTLKRNTIASIAIKITPDRDFTELTSDIKGIILDVPLPFPGYYGTSACPHIYDAEGKEKVGCPLKAGETYTYKNSFKILPIYPPVNLVIHWGMGDKNGDAVCFEIPAKIKT
ncbi:ecdysteroid-regulated 16 kDa protein-like [Anastrepha ludens]|uniref:ecdysteroid-regulated 16 kDa protein-like n=1 Tax=Anastrepha ludens TaxID=28586 RepID=UPI0023AE96CC|nr:ecdysteroid-regulated 16 kDa protein-like [Anastrepha ludens]XP_053945281.1 ecdysteroid-regulated 16 kDa protein-like [Anastrepha ludens]XP_053945282.1 ecdysteroid-regulated 16 kDa protein-like [Anastrepha ludens]